MRGPQDLGRRVYRRQIDPHYSSRPVGIGTAELNAPTLLLQEILSNPKSETRSYCGLCGEKRGEQFLLGFIGDADAIVGNRDTNSATARWEVV